MAPQQAKADAPEWRRRRRLIRQRPYWRFTGVQLARRSMASASARQARPLSGARTTTRPSYEGEGTCVSWALTRRGVATNSPKRSAPGTTIKDTSARRSCCAGMT